MSQLIYINLLIDTLWDPDQLMKKHFNLQLPDTDYLARTYDGMALYLAEPGDVAIVSARSPSHQHYLNRKFGMTSAETINWSDELLTQPQRQRFSTSRFAGVSQNELILARQFHVPSDQGFGEVSIRTIQQLAKINEKQSLVSLSQKAGVSIPPTKILSQAEVLQFLEQNQVAPKFLKYNFGSGGGSNFFLQPGKDSAKLFLKRRLEELHHSLWILQDLVPGVWQGAVYDWEGGAAPRVCEIRYDSHSLSYWHDFQVEPALQNSATSVFEKVREYLRTTYGYQGPLGLDVVFDSNQLFLIDVNARLTKTHLIEAAARAAHTNLNDFISLRLRWKHEAPLQFDRWWTRFEIQSGQKDLIWPYHVLGLESPYPLKEVCLFVKRNFLYQTSEEQIKKWCLNACAE